jgi:hypothetical protein
MTTQFEQLLGRLLDEGVEFIVVGGFAATVHGALRTTLDLDVVYRRTPENLSRVIRALEPHGPYPRGAPPGLPFRWDLRTLQFGSNFTLSTSLGLIDLLGGIAGGGDYEALAPFARGVTMFGRECQCLDLPKLIEVKRAAGRPKDFEAIAELELLRDRQAGGGTDG